ncbi:MAG TPA: glycosyltransferase family 2 protein [Patescibacteria group bacterium]|nr:glycosyltransferase family 2 protein [Patescibacteria group bacterium]
MKTVSIVIPNFKKLPLIKHLPAIIKASQGAEVIVVDDASPDDTANYLKKHFPRVKLVVNQQNERFAVSCNNGFKAARGDIVVLLNSDVAPKANFLVPLIKHFDDESVFAVSCLEIQKRNGKEEFSGRNKCQFKRGFLIHSAAPIGKLKSAVNNCWATGGSSAFDRKKYLGIGGMDKLYKPAYWEDIDLSWVAREKHGWKILFEPKSQVYHNHETTNVSVFGLRQMETMASRNQWLFVWKNIRGLKLLDHFLWLPYHLTFTTIRTKGVFAIGFFQAVIHWFKFNLGRHD